MLQRPEVSAAGDMKTCHNSLILVSSQTVFDNVKSLEDGLQLIKTVVSKGSPARFPEHDQYVPRVQKFLQHAVPRLGAIVSQSTGLQVLVGEVLLYFGQTASDVRVEDIFGTLKSFADLVERAVEESPHLAGGQSLRLRPSQSALSTYQDSQSFDGTLRAMRAGQHGREVSREIRDRPASRVFPPPF